MKRQNALIYVNELFYRKVFYEGSNLLTFYFKEVLHHASLSGEWSGAIFPLVLFTEKLSVIIYI
jgi:hypothetical protein